MSKSGKSKKDSRKKVPEGWPMVVYLGIFGFGIFSYAVARIALDAYPHPIHWAFGLLGVVLGYFVGWLWYRWRGDVI